MNYTDIILAIPLLWAAYRGFTKGLIIELASLVGLVIGIYGSIHFAGYAMDLLINVFGLKSKYLHLISFGVTFIVIILIIYLIAHILEKLIEIVSLTFVNKLAGAVFSILKIAFILSVILYFINIIDNNKTLISPTKRNTSYLYKPISSLALIVIPGIKNIDIVKESFNLKVNPKTPNNKQ